MKGATQSIIPSTTPVHTFDSGGITQAIAVFPDGRRILSRTAFRASVFRLWDLRNGMFLKEMKGHNSPVGCFVISRKGRLIASGDDSGHVIAWDGDTGAPLIPAFRCFRTRSGVQSLDFSPGGEVLAVCSSNGVVTFWSTDTWQQQGEPLYCGPDPNGPSGSTYGVRYSPSGELLILSNSNMQLWNPVTRSRIHIHDTQSCHDNSSVWTPDGTRLLTGGEDDIREWDLSTWNKVGTCNRWEGHTGTVLAIALSPNGTLVASTSKDRHVRLWRLSDARTLAIFQYTIGISCVAFTADGKHVLVGSFDSKISEWAVPSDALLEDAPEATHQSVSVSQRPAAKGQDSDARSQDPDWAIVSRRQPLDEGRQSTGAKSQDSDARGHGLDWAMFSRKHTSDERKQSTAAKRQDSYTKVCFRR
jgi:WD40 repeat protein